VYSFYIISVAANLSAISIHKQPLWPALPR
jgi:hypothetical protein